MTESWHGHPAHDPPHHAAPLKTEALQADAYGGYDGIYADETVEEVGCWAHARRKVVEAETSDPQRSVIVVAHIKLLYKVEEEARVFRDNLPANLRDRQEIN